MSLVASEGWTRVYPVEESFQQLRLEVVHGRTVKFSTRRHTFVVRVMVVCIARGAYASLRGHCSAKNCAGWSAKLWWDVAATMLGS